MTGKVLKLSVHKNKMREKSYSEMRKGFKASVKEMAGGNHDLTGYFVMTIDAYGRPSIKAQPGPWSPVEFQLMLEHAVGCHEASIKLSILEDNDLLSD